MVSANKNPTINGTSAIDLTVGEQVRFDLVLGDADGDEVTLEFWGNLTDYTIDSDGDVYTFIWTPTDTTPVVLTYVYFLTMCLARGYRFDSFDLKYIWNNLEIKPCLVAYSKRHL